MEIIRTDRNGHAVIAATGRLDASTSDDFHAQALALLADAKLIVLDLSQLEYISSSGLRSVLLLAKHAAAAGGSFTVAGAADTVSEVFTLSGFDLLIPMKPTVEEVIQ